ncbi:MAG: response regulator, partial [Clostridia bacterium]|nr:response regulator [Clostridia bacterium]
MKNRNILIVDDDAMITSTLQKVITIMLKQNVIAFNNPSEALKSISENKLEIDLVISDFIMAEMNGIEFLKVLKEISPDTVSILLTGYADKQNAIKSINEIGIFYYMEKPWDNNDLVRIIQNALEKKSLTEQLNAKVRELENRNYEIKTLYMKLEEQYRKESERSTTLETVVAERTASIRNLLDNAGQGFLSFGKDLLVHNDYSSECRRIFGKSIMGESFAFLISEGKTDQDDYMKNVVAKILDSNQDGVAELYLPLMPEAAEILGRSIRIEYRVIKENTYALGRKMMAILTDVTDRIALEKQMEREKSTFKMVMKVMTSNHDFTLCVGEFLDFLSEGLDEIVMNSNTAESAINEIYRQVHTFKGNFSLFDMQETVECIHKAEDKLYELLRMDVHVTREELLCILTTIDLRTGFNHDLAKIKAVLGDKYIRSEKSISIDRITLAEIENHIARRLSSHDFVSVAPLIRAIGYKKVKGLLAVYKDYMTIMAEKCGKLLHPLVIEGGEELLDPDRYSGFMRSLVHVFRNALVHGIETPEERIQKGKSEYGTITCSIIRDKTRLHIDISDDGRGLDAAFIAQKALEKKLASEDALNAMTHEEKLSLIFHDHFSTLSDVDLKAGRGVGLPAVKKELEAIHGQVTLKTSVGKGTTFSFDIPVESFETIAEIDMEYLVEPAAKASIKLLNETLGA